jgi:hypothetical protein
MYLEEVVEVLQSLLPHYGKMNTKICFGMNPDDRFNIGDVYVDSNGCPTILIRGGIETEGLRTEVKQIISQHIEVLIDDLTNSIIGHVYEGQVAFSDV